MILNVTILLIVIQLISKLHDTSLLVHIIEEISAFVEFRKEEIFEDIEFFALHKLCRFF